MNPSQSSSIPLVQAENEFSGVPPQAHVPVQLESAQSVVPSQSLSTPSVQVPPPPSEPPLPQTHEPVEHTSPLAPQDVPSVSREHESVRPLLSHDPLEHTKSVHVREPDSSQVPPYPQLVQLVEPQVTPSVLREQLRVSVRVELPHEPPEQIGSVQVRLWVPVVSQVLEKPPHDP